jgi:hypothetical protein
MSGRKKQSAVWKYFTYESVTDKSKCNLCQKLLSGDNSSNLKTHMRASHKSESIEVDKADEVNISRNKTTHSSIEKSNLGKSISSASGASTSATSTKSIGLSGYFKPTRTPTVYPKDSKDYATRLKLLLGLFANARLPFRLIDQVEFREFCTVLDPCFELPRKFYYYIIIIIHVKNCKYSV